MFSINPKHQIAFYVILILYWKNLKIITDFPIIIHFTLQYITLQYYLTKYIPIKYRKQICRILMSSHNLAIKHRRHTNIPIINRICKMAFSDIQLLNIGFILS